MKKQQRMAFWMSEIVQIRYLLQKESISRDAAEVIFTYFECECLYKKLLWPIAKVKHPNLKKEQLKVVWPVVPTVFKDYGLELDEALLQRIFGSEDRNLAVCSVKKLRDRFVHNCTDYVIHAIIDRKDEIMADLNCLLSSFD